MRKLLKMRRLLMLLLVAITAFVPFRVCAQDIFHALTDDKDVESTYISERFSHNFKVWRSKKNNQSMNFGAGFTSYYSYNCYSKESIDKAESILKDYVSHNKDVDLLMSTVQNGMTKYAVYEKIKDNKIMQMIIWNQSSKNDCEIVVVYWKDGYKKESTEE